MLKEARKVYIVGIGGIGVSGLARILNHSGKKISGSDLQVSEITQKLREEGIGVAIGHRAENITKDWDLLIHSVAVPEDNPERTMAQNLEIPQVSYPEALGELAKEYEIVVAVAGTNGKTTTTAMIATILEQAGMDPTVVVGSEVLAWGSNARIGGKKCLVLEADEYRRAFLNYHPDIAVITNIDVDHLDYFENIGDIKAAFISFLENIKDRGKLIYNLNDDNSIDVAEKFSGGRISFGIGSKDFPEKPDFSAEKIQEQIDLKVPGWFNLVNATAAVAVCQTLGISFEDCKLGLESFIGTWRRFQKLGKIRETDIVSDYAHHPAGIRAALDAAIEVVNDPARILAVFQPHQRNRTKNLFKEFVTAFCGSDIRNFIISEIFDVAGRENEKDRNISSQNLVDDIKKCGKNVLYTKNLEECEERVRSVAANYDMVIFMGAGDIYKVANKLVSRKA